MSQTDLLIGDLPGFTPQIARVVSMMNYARSVTLQAVAGLGVEELDYLHDPQTCRVAGGPIRGGGCDAGSRVRASAQRFQ